MTRDLIDTTMSAMTAEPADGDLLVVDDLSVRFPTADGLVQAVTELSYRVGPGETEHASFHLRPRFARPYVKRKVHAPFASP